MVSVTFVVRIAVSLILSTGTASSFVAVNHKKIGLRQHLPSFHLLMSSAQDNTNNKDMSTRAIKSRTLYTFSEARKKGRAYGFTSKEEFVDYECAGSYQLPKNADEVWADDWTSWEDFLGIPLTFDQAKMTVRDLVEKDATLNSEEAYLELKRGGTISDDELASRLPLKPDLYYKAEW
eukprot:CAMPEP_0194253706 /NCGR_PEP_ID=MMETSP0158-20130606/30449_1 /TAXON_ID=33649 /ORGANISM="Thalassionema nitzschioides, Strain L26-B" /LENGTH=177 /DNA_ID=CAMNT_0038991491 /DNA_START=10 /DNA_END=540 /DNA_ORIENTATION=+